MIGDAIDMFFANELELISGVKPDGMITLLVFPGTELEFQFVGILQELLVLPLKAKSFFYCI